MFERSVFDHGPMVDRGGTHLYRATAECSGCGKVVDVGPFDTLASSVQAELVGWLVPAGLGWSLRDGAGTPVTLCEECMARPLRDVLAEIEQRARANA